MAKVEKALPVITISNTKDNSEISCIPRAYVLSALRGIQIMALEGTPSTSEDIINECVRLTKEIES